MLNKENKFNEKTGDKKMQKSYELANSLLRDRLKNEDEENIKLLDNIDKADVVVVDGTYDHIHLVLQYLKLPFTRVTQQQLMSLKLKPSQTVFVNCAWLIS